MKEKEIKKLIVRVGNRIREIRKKQNLTLLDLSIESEMEENAIQRIEKGRTNPTVKTLYKIAEALNVEIHELFMFSPSENKNQDTDTD